jgi:hypothetical protein
MTESNASTSFLELVASIDENGELPFLQRRWLQEELKHRFGPEKGDLIWLALENISAHKVEPIWEERFPSETAPIDLLRNADSGLVNVENAEALKKLLPKIKTFLDDKLVLGVDCFRAVYTGFACWVAAGNVAYGPSDIIDEGDSELEIDPEFWHASFYASLAYAGGAVWETGVGDSDKRREFWTWFVCEAVPEAISFARRQ